LRSWQIFKFWGIPFKIHTNWFILLFLFSWSISNQINIASSEIYNNKESWIIGFFTSLFFLCSIIFHQIIHTFVSLKEGVKFKQITFFFLGAVIDIDKDCQTAIGNIKISLIRPAFSFFTAFILLIICDLNGTKDALLINIITRVSVLNIFLGFLNLIPYGTLDGAILLKSIIWYFSGSQKKGRLALNKITQISSISALLLGLFLILNKVFYYGFILLILALFGINSSKSESQLLKIESLLKQHDISGLKLNVLRKIEFDLTFKEFNKVIKTYKEKSNNYFFITKDGRWEGFLTVDNLKDVPVKKWENTFVYEYKRPINEFPSVIEGTPLWEIIEKIEITNDGNLLVLNPLGIPKGIIDRNKVGFFILKKLGFNIPSEIIEKIKSQNKYPLGIELPKMIELMKNKGDI
tara:strand:+ start:1895 stop:3118 length:1224 start_codon:yes stop_codon:yes gene_type:complete